VIVGAELGGGTVDPDSAGINISSSLDESVDIAVEVNFSDDVS